MEMINGELVKLVRTTKTEELEDALAALKQAALSHTQHFIIAHRH
jgi:hypothetical protein